jgi:hypothetical protein
MCAAPHTHCWKAISGVWLAPNQRGCYNGIYREKVSNTHSKASQHLLIWRRAISSAAGRYSLVPRFIYLQLLSHTSFWRVYKHAHTSLAHYSRARDAQHPRPREPFHIHEYIYNDINPGQRRGDGVGAH